MKKYNKAFTIVELIVAMSLFMILISIAVGSFINVLRNQRVVVALMAVNDSMNLSLEQMAREIRTGYNFCLTPSNKLQFVNAYNEVIRYKLNNVSSTIERGPSGVFGMISAVCNDDDSGFNYKPITADNVQISNLKIQACGKNLSSELLLDECSAGDSNYPPRLTISLSVTSQEPDVAKLGIYTDIQTTISSRRIE